MKKRLSALALVLALCAALCAPAAADGDYIAAEHTASNGLPYYLMVNRACNTVTVYTLDANGYYTVPYKAMVCSTGRAGHETPLGTFRLGIKNRWCYMVDGSWGQYTGQITGAILFHSVCYRAADASTLMTDEYNLLGNVASRGCVRLQVGDAKWIYDNCGQGTYVTIYDGTSAGALGKPVTAVPEITAEMDNGWDPTDPDEANPWRETFAGGTPLPFEDLAVDAAYYPAVRWAWENGLLSETDVRRLSPEGDVTRAAAAEALNGLAALEGAGTFCAVPKTNAERALTRQELALLLYRYELRVRGETPKRGAPLNNYADAPAVSPVALKAMRWAVGNGVLAPTDARTLAPNETLSRAEFAAVLYAFREKEPAP